MHFIKNYSSKIILLLGDEKNKIPIVVFSFFIISSLDLISLGLIAPYINFVLEGNFNLPENIEKSVTSLLGNYSFSEQVIIIGIFLFSIFVFKSIGALSVTYIIINFCLNTNSKLKTHLIKKYIFMPYRIFLKRNSAEYINTTQYLSNTFCFDILLSLLRLISEFFVIVFIFIALLLVNPEAVVILIMLLIIPLIIFDIFIKKNLSIHGKNLAVSNKNIIQTVSESLNGIKEVRIFGKEDFFIQALNKQAKLYSHSHKWYQIYNSIPRYLLELTLILFIVIFINLHLIYFGNSVSLISTIGVFGVAGIRLLPSMNFIVSSIQKLRYGHFALLELHNDIINLDQTEKSSTQQTTNLDFHFKSIKIQNVSYGYNKINILENASLEINKGEFIGFLGESGSGKTTLLNLILGFLEPSKGTIIINDENHDIKTLRNTSAYIPQSNFIIDDTLRKNIALSEDHLIDDELVTESLKSAKLEKFFQNLTDGLDTVLGEGGLRISGGQRQRIAFARVFYHNRHFLVLDEATNSLDKETENQIISEINNLSKTKTILMVSHNPETLKNCDKIFKIENKSIIALVN